VKRIISEVQPIKNRDHQQRNPKEPSSGKKRKQGEDRQSLLGVSSCRSSSIGRLVSGLVGRLVVLVINMRNGCLVVMVVMMVREEAVMFVVLGALVGVMTREVLLLGVGTDQVLGLVKQRLVGGAGGGAGGVRVLLLGDVVDDRLGGGLVGVGDHVAVKRKKVSLMLMVEEVRVGRENVPPGVVSCTGDSFGDLVGGRLGAVGNDLVVDLCWSCQYEDARIEGRRETYCRRDPWLQRQWRSQTS
jgi:hypothetical protein